MQLLLFSLMFFGGLAVIIKGADWLTDGAAAIARRLGIPTVVVGLTVVAMGSSMPEFVVSVMSAVKGETDIALGNVVGSNIFNIVGILGITALVAPIRVTRGSIRNDVPFALLAAVATVIVAWGGRIERTEGLLMLCIFMVFLSYTLAIGSDSTPGEDAREKEGSVWKPVGLTLVGLAGLLAGGELLVEGGAGAARLMGVPESLVALTFISMGTSAPELAASVMAARKGDFGIALGNVVGSNVFNVFFVLASAATVSPLSTGGITMVDLGMAVAASAVLWLFCRFGRDHYVISRTEGVLLILMGVAYYAWLIA